MASRRPVSVLHQGHGDLSAAFSRRRTSAEKISAALNNYALDSAVEGYLCGN